MRFKKILAVLLALILVCISILIIVSNRNDILKQNDLKDYLFEQKIQNYKRICYDDFLGLTIDGSIFEFYKYELVGNIIINNTQEFPKYKSIFTKDSLLNINSLNWETTPINDTATNNNTNIVFFSNLTEKKCSNIFYKKNYLKREGFYYSYFSAYPIGMYLFIYSPNEKYLYVIRKKG